MKFVNETMQAVVLMVCEKHAACTLEKLQQHPEGNWFVVPSIQACWMGYRSNISASHQGQGCAIFGFAETVALAKILRNLGTPNPDGSLCPDCAAYEWNITPTSLVAKAKDPVCGTLVASDNAFSYHYEGELFYFCSLTCRERFQRTPREFVVNQKALPSDRPLRT